jgi:very-short-patch-repair endonuclease
VGFRFAIEATPWEGVTTRTDGLRAALRVAERQHGAVAIAQLRACGLTARDVRAHVAAGRLILEGPTVAVVCGSPDTWHRRLQVGLLALGDDSWVSHESAAALHGLDRSTERAIEFTVPRRVRRRGPDWAIVHTTATVGPVDVITVCGFRCASATRTILDLAAAGADPDRLAAALDSAMRLHLSAPLVLVERLSELRGPGRYGVRLLDALLLDSGGETMLERRFLALVRQDGLPRPQTQRRVRGNGRHVARVDFLYAEFRIVVEVSGRLGHSNPADRSRDAQRRNELQDLGYAVYEYTWGDVTRRPGYVTDTLRDRLQRHGCVR